MDPSELNKTIHINRPLTKVINDFRLRSTFTHLSLYQDAFNLVGANLLHLVKINSKDYRDIQTFIEKGNQIINQSYTCQNDIYNPIITESTEHSTELIAVGNKTEKYCYAQKMQDGQFIFTSSLRKPLLDNEQLSINGLFKVRVLAHASSKDIQPINHQPSFSQSQSQLHFRPPLKRQKATQFIDFGVFSSFAPNCDSSRAELSVMETSLGLKRKYMVVYENVEDSTETGDDIQLMNEPLHAFDGTKAITDLNFVDVVAVKEGKDESSCIPDKNEVDTFLEKFKCIESSLDLTSGLLNDLSTNGINLSSLYNQIGEVVSTDLLIKQNTLFIKELEEYQEKRFAIDDHVLSRGELNVVKNLESNLTLLLDQGFKPNLTTMKRQKELLGLKAVNFPGTLPKGREKALFGNSVVQLPFMHTGASTQSTQNQTNQYHLNQNHHASQMMPSVQASQQQINQHPQQTTLMNQRSLTSYSGSSGIGGINGGIIGVKGGNSTVI